MLLELGVQTRVSSLCVLVLYLVHVLFVFEI